MNTDIEQILNEVKLLSDSLKSKGWSGAFFTNDAYPDQVGQSIEKYLYQSMLGNEKGIGEGLNLRTYAKYEHIDAESVICDFTVRLVAANRLKITEMNISHLNRHNDVIRSKNIEVGEQSQLLSRQQAINQVIAPPLKKSIGHRRFKI